MSIQNAIHFIEAYRLDAELREYFGVLETAAERRSFLKEIDMPFYDEEFEEACNLLLLRCSDEGDHNILMQLKISYIELMATQ